MYRSLFLLAALVCLLAIVGNQSVRCFASNTATFDSPLKLAQFLFPAQYLNVHSDAEIARLEPSSVEYFGKSFMLWSDEDFDSFLAAVKKFAEEGASPLVGQNDVPTWKDCFGSERTSNVFHSADFAIEKSLEFVNNVKEKSDLNKQRQQHELQMKTRLEEDLKEQQKKQQTLEEAIKISKKIETQIAAPKTDVKVNTEVSAAKWFNVDSFSMADHKDKIVVVDFWATWNSECRKTIPHLKKLYETYKDKGVVIVSLTDEPAAIVEEFNKKAGMTWAVGANSDSAVAYGVSGFPACFLVVDGKFVWQGHPMNGLDAAITKHLVAKNPLLSKEKQALELKLQEEKQKAEQQRLKELEEKELAAIPDGILYSTQGPAIKGLSIGMCAIDALKILKEKIPQDVWAISKHGSGYLISGSYLLSGPVVIAADKDKRVILIAFQDTNNLFNTTDLTAEQFAKEIISAYKIPPMQLYTRQEGNSLEKGWEYSGQEGWKISINYNKHLILSAIAKPSERTFD